jgi:hypothetical protein
VLVVRKIHVVSRIDGGVARQQQLDDFNVTLRGGEVQRGPFVEGTLRTLTACTCNQIILHDIDFASLYHVMNANAVFAFKAGGGGSLHTSNASIRTKTAFGSAVEASSLHLDLLDNCLRALFCNASMTRQENDGKTMQAIVKIRRVMRINMYAQRDPYRRTLALAIKPLITLTKMRSVQRLFVLGCTNTQAGRRASPARSAAAEAAETGAQDSKQMIPGVRAAAAGASAAHVPDQSVTKNHVPTAQDELAWEHNMAKLLGGDMHELAEVAVEV